MQEESEFGMSLYFKYAYKLGLREPATQRWQRGGGWKNIETQRAQSFVIQIGI